VVKPVLKGESHRTTARRLLRDCIVNNVTLIVPPFFESECDTVILKRVEDGRLGSSDAEKAFAGLDKVIVQTLTHPNLRRHARGIAIRFGLRTAYDAAYAALAELRGCEFWTADREFYDTVKAALPFVKYLPDYP
jgi:predicted nucleic acid-binding protein